MCDHAKNPYLLITMKMYYEALIIIEDLFLTIPNKALVQFGMTAPNHEMYDLFDRELQREQEFNANDLLCKIEYDQIEYSAKTCLKHIHASCFQ